MANPLAKQRIAPSASWAGPCAGDDPQGWCDQRNANLNRPDVEWVVGSGGALVLRTKPSVIAQRIADEKRRFTEEGRKALHRLRYPAAGEGFGG